MRFCGGTSSWDGVRSTAGNNGRFSNDSRRLRNGSAELMGGGGSGRNSMGRVLNCAGCRHRGCRPRSWLLLDLGTCRVQSEAPGDATSEYQADFCSRRRKE